MANFKQFNRWFFNYYFYITDYPLTNNVRKFFHVYSSFFIFFICHSFSNLPILLQSHRQVLPLSIYFLVVDKSYVYQGWLKILLNVPELHAYTHPFLYKYSKIKHLLPNRPTIPKLTKIRGEKNIYSKSIL